MKVMQPEACLDKPEAIDMINDILHIVYKLYTNTGYMRNRVVP